MNNFDIQVDENIVAGRNAVTEALKGSRTVEKLYVAHGDREGSIIKIIAMAKSLGVPIVEADKLKLQHISGTRNHQGVIAFCTTYRYYTIDDMITSAAQQKTPPFLLIIDGIQDPGNLGAIIRTANACGVHGIILPKRGTCSLTTAVFKAAAGACEYTKIARVTNIADTVERLKKLGIWIYGTDGEAGDTIYDTNFTDSCAIILGDEGKGISRLVKERCDFLSRIPMQGNISSLNVSVAGAVYMYEVYRQRAGYGKVENS